MDKLTTAVFWLMVLNSLYWGFSEKYLYYGDFIYGLFLGVIVSAVCATGGYFVGYLFLQKKGRH